MPASSRREFLKLSAALAAATGTSTLGDAIQRAMAIAPEPGSSYLDAEHVVILMQENRSFDHAFYGFSLLIPGTRGDLTGLTVYKQRADAAA
jgi:phospholipase C